MSPFGFLAALVYISLVNAIIDRDSSWPRDLCTPFSYPTNSPMNFNSSRAETTATPTVISYVANFNETQTITNTGYSITVTSNNSKNYFHGGFLESKYVFERLNIFWASCINGSASNTVDGEGTPLQGIIILRNCKYPSMDEAIKHRDGLLIIENDIYVEDCEPNPLFNDIYQLLQTSIRKVGSTSVSAGFTYQWLVKSPLIFNYLAYPGSYIDLENGHQEYDCATIIVNPQYNRPKISITQFNAFLQLKNQCDDSFNNVLIPVEQDNRPLIIGQCSYPSVSN